LDLSSVISGLIVAAIMGIASYAFKAFFFDGSRLSFGSSPRVAGTYKSEYFDAPADWGAETVTIRQFGKRIWGTILDDSSPDAVKFSGTVTPSRIIRYTFQPFDRTRNDYGVGLLKLDKYGTQASGLVLFLDDNNENPIATRLLVKKK
jgi:hypothetical protein